MQAEVEMRRKVELIQQIRAMESVPLIRTKFVDFTETGGQGLLSEMSVAEVSICGYTVGSLQVVSRAPHSYHLTESCLQAWLT